MSPALQNTKTMNPSTSVAAPTSLLTTPASTTTAAAVVNHQQRLAQPLHIQRLTASLDMGPLMAYAQNLLVRPLTSSEDSDSDANGAGDALNMSDDIGMSKRGNNIVEELKKNKKKIIIVFSVQSSSRRKANNVQFCTNRTGS